VYFQQKTLERNLKNPTNGSGNAGTENENNRHACEPYTCECCECGGIWMVHIPHIPYKKCSVLANTRHANGENVFSGSQYEKENPMVE